jgi:hypothetical protein
VTTTLRTGRGAAGSAVKASKMEPPYRQISSAHDRYCVYIRVCGSRATIRPVSDGPSVRVALSMYVHSTPAAVAGTKNDMATLAPVLITCS